MNPRKPIFIAEIKTQSMYGFKSPYSRSTLIDTAIEHGDWISIHTDPRFGGSFDDIYILRNETKKPILAKGFHCCDDDVKKAIDLGADYVLVVDRLSRKLLESYPDKILFELSHLDYIHKVSHDFLEFGKFVYNGRSLKTGIGRKSIEGYHKYRETFNWVCGASLIKRPNDVQAFYPNCDAFIVGENLMEYVSFLKYSKIVSSGILPKEIIRYDGEIFILNESGKYNSKSSLRDKQNGHLVGEWSLDCFLAPDKFKIKS